MAITHFPKDSSWQLMETPMTRGEFLRQPVLRPSFFAEGLKLVSPTRSQTDIRNKMSIIIDNPQRRWMIVKFGKKGEKPSVKCHDPGQAVTLDISCPLPSRGTFEVLLFSSDKEYSTYQFVGRLEFNKRG